jgi:hypothetical protein
MQGCSKVKLVASVNHVTQDLHAAAQILLPNVVDVKKVKQPLLKEVLRKEVLRVQNVM